MVKPSKQPKLDARNTPKGVKEPKIAAEPPSYNHLKASWRVRHVQMTSPYGWHALTLAEIGNIREKLGHFESMTWNEIFVDAKKQNHGISVSELRCDMARGWMRQNMPDQPTLWTLRLSGPERIWGVFSGGLYQVIFWDPEHLIYPTKK